MTAMPRSAYKHWHNDQRDAQLMFVTTTCLDFAHLIARPEMRTRMAKSILSDCVHYGALLYAYVVMTHHFHLVVQAPGDKTVSWLVQRIKTNSSKLLAPLLSEFELGQLNAQLQLNKSQLWMRSFRGISINDERMLRQKTAYVHDNPIRSELCVSSVNFLWSSARAAVDGPWDDSSGLALACLQDLNRTLQTTSLEG